MPAAWSTASARAASGILGQGLHSFRQCGELCDQAMVFDHVEGVRSHRGVGVDQESGQMLPGVGPLQNEDFDAARARPSFRIAGVSSASAISSNWLALRLDQNAGRPLMPVSARSRTEAEGSVAAPAGGRGPGRWARLDPPVPVEQKADQVH